MLNTKLLVIFALAATLLLYGCIGGTSSTKSDEAKAPAEVKGPSAGESAPPLPVTEKPAETPAPSVHADSGEDVPPALPE